MHTQNMFDKAIQMGKCFTVFDQMPDFIQILSNTIQHVQTWCSNGKVFSPKQCLFTKQCLKVFDCQTFTVWTEVKDFLHVTEKWNKHFH